MIKQSLLFLSVLIPCYGFSTDAAWLAEAMERADPKAIEWVKQRLQEDLNIIEHKSLNSPSLESGKKCHLNFNPEHPESIPNVYICISFSVPIETWLSLSKEMEKTKAIFILRGLPDNSFKKLSKRIQKLGVAAPIQINPKLFSDHEVERVPAFLILDQDHARKISGNISLSCALEKMGGL